MRALARVGRDVNAMEEGNRRTALHYAAGYGDSATARALVQSGADVNARDRAGMTALGWACLKGRVRSLALTLTLTLTLTSTSNRSPNPRPNPHPNPYANPYPHPHPNPKP